MQLTGRKAAPRRRQHAAGGHLWPPLQQQSTRPGQTSRSAGPPSGSRGGSTRTAALASGQVRGEGPVGSRRAQLIHCYQSSSAEKAAAICSRGHPAELRHRPAAPPWPSSWTPEASPLPPASLCWAPQRLPAGADASRSGCPQVRMPAGADASRRLRLRALQITSGHPNTSNNTQRTLIHRQGQTPRNNPELSDCSP